MKISDIKKGLDLKYTWAFTNVVGHKIKRIDTIYIRLEHANVPSPNPQKTANWMQKVFDRSIWREGETQDNGYSIHIGDIDSYIAIYKLGIKFAPRQRSYAMSGHVNHVGIVVDDLDEIEQRVRSVGFKPHMHANYEPGRRFYFYD